MQILIIGAGRSATDAIEYLLQYAESRQWRVVVGDFDAALAEQKVGSSPAGKAIAFNVKDDAFRKEHIAAADIVLSFLPADMHLLVANDCLALKKHLVTASYVSPEMRALDGQAREAGLIFLNEIGLDPGLDHMSAMRNIHDIRSKGGKLLSFISSCGALVAPESNDNEWGYKFTWRPMNVILAGQGGAARYIQDGELRFIPYHRLFQETQVIQVPGGYRMLEAYANRDSLSYLSIYGIEDIPTLMRCTLRVQGFCEGWNALIQLGLTDNSYRIQGTEKMTYAQFTRSFLPAEVTKLHPDLRHALASFLGVDVYSEVIGRLQSIGLLDETLIPNKHATPAEVLHDLLEARWVFREGDIDTNVLVDEFVYELGGTRYRRTSSLAVNGIDAMHTAISRTVGLPAAIGVTLIAEGKIPQRGVLIPIYPEIYEPVLERLAPLGIAFEENEWDI